MTRHLALALSLNMAVGCALARPHVFQPQPPMSVSLPNDAKLIEAKSPTGVLFLAFYFLAPPGAPTIVHFHGNAEQLNDIVGLGKRYQQAGLGFFAIEYPGYGMATGRPSESRLYDSADAAISYLRDTLHVDNSSMVLEGATLGAGVATEMARRGYGARMILIAPFLSADSLMEGGVVTDHFDVVDKAPQVGQPVLIVHGSEDEVVPLSMAQQLATAFPHATLRIVRAASHGEALDSPPVFEEISRFAYPSTKPPGS